jgi:hypothetical protein
LIASSPKVLHGADTHTPARRIVISLPQKQLTFFEGESIVVLSQLNAVWEYS